MPGGLRPPGRVAQPPGTSNAQRGRGIRNTRRFLERESEVHAWISLMLLRRVHLGKNPLFDHCAASYLSSSTLHVLLHFRKRLNHRKDWPEDLASWCRVCRKTDVRHSQVQLRQAFNEQIFGLRAPRYFSFRGQFLRVTRGSTGPGGLPNACCPVRARNRWMAVKQVSIQSPSNRHFATRCDAYCRYTAEDSTNLENKERAEAEEFLRDYAGGVEGMWAERFVVIGP